MTRFRFRAWDCEEKAMLRPEDIQSWEVIHLMHNETHVIMQSTGLMDRSGKEIFEGDILRRLDEAYLVDDIFPLHRHTHVTNIGFWDGKRYQLRDAGGANDNNDDWMSWPEEYEVIGNIYENPSILPS